MSEDTFVWKSGEALDHSLSNFGTLPNELVSVTGPSTAMATLIESIYDFRVYVGVGITSPPPERWTSWVELMLVLHHDPGAAGSHPTPFSDDPRVLGTQVLNKELVHSPSTAAEYYMWFTTGGTQRLKSRRVGSGSAFNPSHVVATLWLFDPGFDMDGVFAYSTGVNWFGSLRTLYLTGT